MSSIASSSPIGQGPKPSPMSQLRSIDASVITRDRLGPAGFPRGKPACSARSRPAAPSPSSGLSESFTVGRPSAEMTLQTMEIGSSAAIRRKPAEIIGQQRAPAVAEAHASAENADGCRSITIHVEPIGEDRKLVACGFWPRARHQSIASSPPSIGSFESMRMPVQAATQSGRVLQEIGRAIGVGQDDAEVALVILLPILQHPIGRLGELLVAVGQGRIDHGQFVRVGADGLDLTPQRDQAVGRAEERRTQPSIMACTHQSCHRKPCRRRVPKSEMREIRQRLQTIDLLPDPRHGAGIEHLQLELAHVLAARRASAAR